jgi:hypothetical protein
MRVNSKLYVLGADGNPKEEADLLVWARWYETADRFVAQTWSPDERIEVVTFFTGIDNQYGDGVPLFFETMVLVRGKSQDGTRYTDRAAALAGHEEFLARWISRRSPG